MKLRFSGSRVLLLGGSCELALSTADMLIQEGLYPILTWRNDRGKHKISSRLERYLGCYETAFLDFSVRESIPSLFMHMDGNLDYLVDFAQGHLESLVGSVAPDSLYPYFSINVSARAEILCLASRAMLKKKKGRLLFISSAAASRPNSGQGFYAAAKLASEALYRNLGLELGKLGITTITLRPGYIDAGRGADYLRSSEDAIARTPLGRPLSCQEVAETVVFLLSESAGAFNATEISMDGGLTAGKPK